MKLQPGKVSIQVNIISLTTDQLTDDNRLAAPTPIIAVVFVCVVLTGNPNKLDMRRQREAETSAEKP